MAFTYGFYNYDEDDPSTEKKLYDAEQVSQLFDGIISEGVYSNVGERFVVHAINNGQIVLKPGRAWLNHTWNYSPTDIYSGTDALESVPAAPTFEKRIDTLVIDVDNTSRKNRLMWLPGVESATPAPRELVNLNTHKQYPICYISREAGEVIKESDIEMCVGTPKLPFVSGIINSMEKIYSETLVSGATQVIFRNVVHGENSLINVGGSNPGLEYSSVSISESNPSTITVTFEPQANDVTIYLIVTEVN